MTAIRRLPAEWAPQSAIMLTWPHAGTDWAAHLPEVSPVFEAIARAVLARQNLLVSCEDRQQVAHLQQLFDDWTASLSLPGRARVFTVPADDTWARDHGPITVIENDKARLLDFAFNAWGGKFPFAKDHAINGLLHVRGAFGQTPLESVEMVLEGGSIETDGLGTLLTTRACLLAPTRNPTMDQAAVEASLSALLGVERFLWLDNGYLAGDDTDSHIDTLARFCSPQRICYVRCEDTADEHYPALKAMEKELQAFRQSNGEPYELRPLPWPDAIYDENGERLPATYANFLIINGAVLLPVYQVPQDSLAIAAIQQCFPDHEVVPIDCRALIAQHGSLHCVTMQIPQGVLE